MPKIDEYFERMIEAGASDLHLSVGVPIRMRMHGDLVPLTDDVCSAAHAAELVGEILSDAQREHFEKTRDLDLAYQMENGTRFRCNIFEQHRGLGAVFRTIPAKILTVEQLGLPQSLLNFCALYKGLVLVTGATGSGKSTTLAAMIDYINRTEKQHILTVEDPVEFVHPDKGGCLVNQREVGHHTQTFASALRAALREDPDVILVGEMRDLETIELAITAAETGHLVFGTLHTTSAAKTTDRIINVFPTSQQEQIRAMLAESLAGVVCQYLLKKSDGKGRVAALEIMVANSAVSSLIREGKTYQIPSILQTGRKLGMQSMDQALAALVNKKLVPLDAAYGCATSKEALDRALMAGDIGIGGPETSKPSGKGDDRSPGGGRLVPPMPETDRANMARARMGGK